MPTAEARIATDRPSRYLVQLCRHAQKMGGNRHHLPRLRHGAASPHRPPEMRHVEWSDTGGTITLEWGRCALRTTSDALMLSAEADDEEGLRRIQRLITARVERIGRRDHLTVTWQAASAS